MLTALGELATDEGATERAAAQFGESVQLHAEHSEHLGIMFCLIGLGKLAAARRRPEAAARVLGAAEALRENRGLSLPQDHCGPHDRCVAHVRADLGDEAFAAAWMAGRAMPLEQAVNEAGALAAGLTIASTTTSAPTLTFGLSERERDVLRLMAEGFSDQQIADRLVISERTARFHVTSLFNKLGAENRAQAVALASQRGLL